MKIVVIEFSSVFNTLQSHLLVDTLVNMSVNSLLIKWINSFLVNHTQQVKFNSAIPTSRTVNTEPLKVAYFHRYCTHGTQKIVKPLAQPINSLSMQMTPLLWVYSTQTEPLFKVLTEKL